MAALAPKYGPREDTDDVGSGGRLLARCETDDTIHLGQFTKHKPTQRWRLVVMHGAAILSYGIITLLVIRYLDARQCHRQSLIYSPADAAIEYKTQKYKPNLLGDPDYFGKPSPHIDEKWNRLLEPSTIHLTETERQHYDPKTPIVQFPDGTYFGQLMVYHELHCLKRLYQYINADYYFPNLTDREAEMNRRHTEHCLGTLRQGIMCHGDISVMPMIWGQHTSVPLGDFSNPHECIDFDLLHEWARKRAVTNALEPGILIHPKLGPSFPDGHGTKIGFSDEDVGKDGNLIGFGNAGT